MKHLESEINEGKVMRREWRKPNEKIFCFLKEDKFSFKENGIICASKLNKACVCSHEGCVVSLCHELLPKERGSHLGWANHWFQPGLQGWAHDLANRANQSPSMFQGVWTVGDRVTHQKDVAVEWAGAFLSSVQRGAKNEVKRQSEKEPRRETSRPHGFI